MSYASPHFVMFEKSIARVEALLKGMVFDCHACGQCVLRQTGLICPMSCPKGLRNGPCGGTLHGECEVYPDKQCVWVRIHDRNARSKFNRPYLLPSPDARLHHTSSYLNHLLGADTLTREPLPYLCLGTHRTLLPAQTPSGLEGRLKAGAFVRTCELRAPRGTDFTAFREEALLVRGHFDAVNATAYLNARPSLPSPVVAAELVQLGIEPVCQSTCRDHTKTTFIAELLQNQLNAVPNVLCLTGDSYAGVPKIKQVFDMDGALMVYEARHLRETGVVHFTGERMTNPPKPFLGAAINPFTEPANVPIRRLKQKVAAGVDFIQTQLVFDIKGFECFMERVVAERIHEDVFILAGIPVVTSRAGLAVLPRIPGVHLPQAAMERLERAPDLAAEGVAFAAELATAASRIPGVAGVHLMLFGPTHAVLPQIAAALPDESPSNPTPSCLSPT
ncbi:MAG: methylenetetrahydrofolate reductase C-terminal domain-containing protein [Verrucomicrobia bacterium]|nr:methylenetetrahydrofolate reductase C-terminal domain-containing protein [Verrucomicrobiota bacterium]